MKIGRCVTRFRAKAARARGRGRWMPGIAAVALVTLAGGPPRTEAGHHQLDGSPTHVAARSHPGSFSPGRFSPLPKMTLQRDTSPSSRQDSSSRQVRWSWRPDPAVLARVVRETEGLDGLRSALARSLSAGGAPDLETFQRVCRPVGLRAKHVSRETGWTVEQLAVRYRNPAHAPDREARDVQSRLAATPGLMGMWLRTSQGGVAGFRYFRRITVEPACLACHGAKDARPAFVRERYPRDRAYGFQPGDLRGLYAVFVPDSLPGDRAIQHELSPAASSL